MKSQKALYLKLSLQAYLVLDELKYQYGSCYIVTLAYNLSIPVASVRRAIQELRRNGHNVTLANGYLRLHRGA